MITEKEYIKAKEVVKEYEGRKCHELSFWYMRCNHTFTRPEGETFEEIIESYKKIAKENSYGCVCPIIILDEKGREIRRVGKLTHVKGTEVDLTEWLEQVSSDQDVIELMKLKKIKKC